MDAFWKERNFTINRLYFRVRFFIKFIIKFYGSSREIIKEREKICFRPDSNQSPHFTRVVC